MTSRPEPEAVLAEAQNLPIFLQSIEDLSQHFEEHFELLGTNERGDSFLEFAKRLIPFTDSGREFPPPEVSERKSHDGGVDLLTADNEAGDKLYIQSKYRITKKDDIDSIISKFEDYEKKLRPRSRRPLLVDDEPYRKPFFMVISSSKLRNIVDKYLKSQVSSRTYYDLLHRENRLSIVDGNDILGLLQRLYRKSYVLPSQVEVESPSGWVSQGSVHLGAVRASAIVALYERYGDALFFENIRDFLGATSGKKEVDDRETVNGQIIKTIREDAPRMLEKNNGITLRATSATCSAGNKLLLDGAAIVNGCQTTMCLWQCRQAITSDCFVAVKVVQTDDGWAVAKSANYQNPIAQIDLDLARYLRPQLVQRAATKEGYAMKSESHETIIGVLDSIHQKLVEYDEMKYLYLGLFSRKPNNIFDDNYTELRADVLEGLSGDAEQYENQVFGTVFLIVSKAREAISVCKDTFNGPEYDHFFKRFHDPEKPKYRSYIAILAICGAIKGNISNRATESELETQRMKQFLDDTRHLLESNPGDFEECYLYAYKIVAQQALDAWKTDSESLVSQEMHKRISRTNFDALYTQLRMEIDVARKLQRS